MFEAACDESGCLLDVVAWAPPWAPLCNAVDADAVAAVDVDVDAVVADEDEDEDE